MEIENLQSSEPEKISHKPSTFIAKDENVTYSPYNDWFQWGEAEEGENSAKLL